MTIQHIVLIKFKPETTPEQRASWNTGANALIHTIPQLKELKSGKHTPHPADGGWDTGIIGVFDSFEDLKIYAVSDPHMKFVESMAPYVADKLAFDIEA